MKKHLMDIAVLIKHETERAYLCETGEGNKWFPKSIVEVFEADGGTVMTMPYWLAKDKGLI